VDWVNPPVGLGMGSNFSVFSGLVGSRQLFGGLGWSGSMKSNPRTTLSGAAKRGTDAVSFQTTFISSCSLLQNSYLHFCVCYCLVCTALCSRAENNQNTRTTVIALSSIARVYSGHWNECRSSGRQQAKLPDLTCEFAAIVKREFILHTLWSNCPNKNVSKKSGCLSEYVHVYASSNRAGLTTIYELYAL